MIVTEKGGASSPADPFELVGNVCEAERFANMRATMERGLPILQVAPAHEGEAVIVGGGPSLARSLEDIRARKAAGATIFALNGAAGWLLARGIAPDYLVIIDARASNARFLDCLPGNVRTLLCTHCHPSIFDAAVGHEITTWHANYEGRSGVLETRRTVAIGGGTTLGLFVLKIAHVLGFRRLIVCGLDSSYEADQGHAYAQPENDGEEVVEVRCGGRTFRASPWMVAQANDFQDVASTLAAEGCDIAVHGDGLLPEVARQMALARGRADEAVYDLGQAPASFDFMHFLAAAELERRASGLPGPLRVKFPSGPKDGFRADDLPGTVAYRQQMLDSVLRPALTLFDAVEDPDIATGRSYPYAMRPLVDAFRNGHDIPRIDVPHWAFEIIDDLVPSDAIVITLREAPHWPARNSNVEAWIRAAREIGRTDPVVIVRDTGHAADPIPGIQTVPLASINLIVRAALYERAKASLMITGGPGLLCELGSRPYRIFMPRIEGYIPSDPDWLEQHKGLDPITRQVPFALPSQRLVWAPDSYKNIMAAWQDLSVARMVPKRRSA